MLTRLIYESTARCSIEEARPLCMAARDANALKHITGALYFSGTHFLQCLEGEEIAVAALFARIQRDERHADCRLLDCRVMSSRSFKGWSMAWIPTSRETITLMAAFTSAAPGAPLPASDAGAFFVALAQTGALQ